MRASSVKTLAAVVAAVDAALGKASIKAGTQVAEEFFSLSRLFEDNIRLARNLSDPARAAGDKQMLVKQILQSKVSDATAEGLRVLAAGRWSSETDLEVSCRIVGKHVLLKTAQDNSELDEVEREIFSMGQVITQNRQLRNFLTDSHAAPTQKRIEFFNKLVESQVNPLSLRLIDAVIEKAQPGRIAAEIRALLDSAARLRQQQVATVYTAGVLSEAQQQRLRQLLSARAGSDVVVNIVVDPALVGGMRIQHGDTVMDGAVSRRANEIRRKLAS